MFFAGSQAGTLQHLGTLSYTLDLVGFVFRTGNHVICMARYIESKVKS
jgi:hypothetical protein